ncbi:hypothetical protein IAT38_005130 [Cryptococcus sp. DSM 104549]
MPVDMLPGQTKASDDLIAVPLWGEGGLVYDEVFQDGGTSACWFASALIVLVKLNPHSITKLVEDTGIGHGVEGAKTDEAKFKLLNTDGEWQTMEVENDKAMMMGIDNMDTDYWWPGGFAKAALQMGGYKGTKNSDKMSGGPSSEALHMLTGFESLQMSKGTASEMFSKYIQGADHTPIILETKDSGTSKLQKDHAFAVMSSSGEADGSPRVRLRDPLKDGTTWYDLDEIYDDILAVSILTNFDPVG